MNTFDVKAFLEHHGVKGMKWGQRRAANKEARKDANWADRRSSPNVNIGRMHGKTTQRIINDATKAMKPEINALNKKEEYNTPEAKLILKKDRGSYKGTHPISVKYNKEVSAIYMRNVKKVAANHLGVSPSGKWKESLVIGKDSWDVQIKQADEAKHSGIVNPDISIRIRPISDEDGYIVDFELLENDLAQSLMELGSDFLEHHGVKGQKWGVRKRRNESARAKAFGGGKTRFKDIKAKDLSDDEINKRIKRLELEKKYVDLNKGKVKAGKDYAGGILSNSGKSAAAAAVGTGVSFVVGRALKKRLGG